MDPRIYGLLQQVGGEADDARREELRSETNEELARHFMRHPNELEELAFDLLNIAWADSLTSDVLQQVIDVKTVALGEVDYIEDDLRGMTAYWQGKGGQIRSGILRYERERMPTEEIVAAIDMHQDEFRLNFWGPFDKLSQHAQEKMRILPVERLVELVQAAVTAGVTYGTFASATLTAAQVDSVLDEVALRSSGQVTILGSLVAVRKLAKVGLEFGDNIKEQIFRTGVIGNYKGYNVVQVENFENFLGEFVLPHDELWIVGRNAGRLTYYGDQAKVQQLRLPSFYFRWETARDAGMLLYGAGNPATGGKGRVGRIKLT
jgi:hypothetical protein